MIAAASLCSDFLSLFPANDLREAAYTFYALLSEMAVIRARPRCHRLRPPPAPTARVSQPSATPPCPPPPRRCIVV